MAVATEDWKRKVWTNSLRRVSKVIGYILFFPALLALAAAVLGIFLAIIILLGILWFISLGHISLVGEWIEIVDREVKKIMDTNIGKLAFRVLLLSEE